MNAINSSKQPHTSTDRIDIEWDFGDGALCTPVIKQITILSNVTAVWCNSHQFYASLLPPDPKTGQSILTILFIAQNIGPVEAILYIKAKGEIKPLLTLMGNGVENAFKLRPVLNHKLSLSDVHYRRSISLYNPYSDTIHVKQVFASEKSFKLFLDPNAVNGSQWNIPPHHNKIVVNVGFDTTRYQKGTFRGFIHIITDHDSFVVPIEFVLTDSGVHSVVEEIDFGTFFSPTDQRHREITLLNAYSREHVTIFDSTIKPDEGNQVSTNSRAKHGQVEFKRVSIAPNSISNVARVTFFATEQGVHKGLLLFHTNDTVTPTVSIPYRARVNHGTLDYRLNSTAFHVNTDASHDIVLMNSFSTPLMFRSAQIFDKRFQISDFKNGFVLPTNGKAHVLTIQFKMDKYVNQRKTNLILDTNITRLFFIFLTVDWIINPLNKPIETRMTTQQPMTTIK
jgi:hypothetical protein